MTQQQRLKELKKYGNTPSRQGRAATMPHGNAAAANKK